jgi:hypothetical protein
MKNIENAWAVNESLLQSYRSTFIASQSFLLVVGSILLNDDIKPCWLLGFVSISALVMIWVVWFRVVVSRARAVDYYKFQLVTEVAAHPDFCKSEEAYISNKDAREKMNVAAGKKNWRLTRKKVDLFLPVLFSIIWGTLIYAKYYA